MRKIFILGMSLIIFTISSAQVGINTTTPTTTLQIDGKDVTTKVAGLIIPRFTGDEIFYMPISIAQGYTAASSANYSNLVYATSAASVANQTSTGRGEFLTTSGFFYWDDPGQKWRRFFVATSSAAGNDGVVKIDGGAGGVKPTVIDFGNANGFGNEKRVIYTAPLTFAPSPTTSWPETTPDTGNATTMTPFIYDEVNDLFKENPVPGQVHLWRVIIKLTAGASSAGSVMATLRNPDPLSGFQVTSVELIPSGSNAGSILTFNFYTIADNFSIGDGKGYQLWLDANKVVSAEVLSVTRVSLFKD